MAMRFSSVHEQGTSPEIPSGRSSVVRTEVSQRPLGEQVGRLGTLLFLGPVLDRPGIRITRGARYVARCPHPGLTRGPSGRRRWRHPLGIRRRSPTRFPSCRRWRTSSSRWRASCPTAPSLPTSEAVGPFDLVPGGDERSGGGALLADGSLLLVGTAEVGASDSHVVAAKLDPGGQLDPTFGIGGKTSFTAPLLQPIISGVGVQPDGGLLVAGHGVDGATFEARPLFCELSPSGSPSVCTPSPASEAARTHGSSGGGAARRPSARGRYPGEHE